jgi:PST family polysaccharide transporter
MADRTSFFGAFALSAATVLKLAVQLLVLPVLARIVGPSSYGVVGLAMPFILFANMLCDGGLAAALARKREVSRELESTIFWISLALATGASLVLCAAAWPMALFFHEPALSPVLASLTLVLVLSATLSVANSRITRERRFVLFAVGEVAATVVGAIVAISLALRGFGVWSLVVQQLVFWSIKALWLFPASGFRPSRQFAFRAALPHLGFGAHMVGANLGDFAAKNLPMIMIAAALGSTTAGHYALANQLGRIPELVVAGPLYLPIFIAAARAQGQDHVTNLVNRMLRVGVTVLAPLYCGWAMIADIALPMLLGPKWTGADALLRVIAPASFAMCLYVLLAAVLQGIGRSEVQFRLSFTLAVFIAGACALGTRLGALAAVAGIAFGTLVVTPLYLRAASRELGARARDLLDGCFQPIAATGAMALTLMIVRDWVSGFSGGLQIIALVVAGVGVYASALLVLSRDRLWEDVRALLPASGARA